MTQALLDSEFTVFRNRVLKLIGLDLEYYKGSQLKRRLDAFLRRHQLNDLTALAHKLEKDTQLLKEFRDYLTINVSEFYRNAEKFDELARIHLPALLKKHQTLSVWSAGCSHGAEIYTVTMILEELTPGRKHQLLATDVDNYSLERAGQAIYTENEVRSLPERLRKRYFHPSINGSLQLDRRLVERVELRRHDLLKDLFPRGVHLILCRNVVIYFTEEAKARLYQRFVESLAPGGLLFIGATETIFQPQKLGLDLVASCFYRKQGA